MISQRDLNRFWSKVDRAGDDNCWLWRAATQKGYGRFRLNGRVVYAHRVSLIIVTDERLDLEARHVCPVPVPDRRCCNPAHLAWGTHRDNVRDIIAARGVHSSARLTADAVREVRSLLGKEPIYAIAERFGVTSGSISHIKSGRTWSHVP